MQPGQGPTWGKKPPCVKILAEGMCSACTPCSFSASQHWDCISLHTTV